MDFFYCSVVPLLITGHFRDCRLTQFRVFSTELPSHCSLSPSQHLHDLQLLHRTHNVRTQFPTPSENVPRHAHRVHVALVAPETLRLSALVPQPKLVTWPHWEGKR